MALIAGMIIFPACFAFGVNPGQGPSLIFITLPNIFNAMSGGRIWGTLFFLCMFFAAASTIIAVFENIITFVNGTDRMQQEKICNLQSDRNPGFYLFHVFSDLMYGVGFLLWAQEKIFWILRFPGKQQSASDRKSGISSVLYQLLWMGMEEIYEGSEQRTGNPVPEMGKGVCVIYFAADRAVYLCTGIYHHVLKHIGE